MPAIGNNLSFPLNVMAAGLDDISVCDVRFNISKTTPRPCVACQASSDQLVSEEVSLLCPGVCWLDGRTDLSDVVGLPPARTGSLGSPSYAD